MLRYVVVVAVAMVTCDFVASAEEPMPPDEDFARREYQAGADAYARAAYEVALRHFNAAREARPAPAFDYNIARCLDRLGRWSDASDAYAKFLAEDPRTDKATEVRARITELRSRTARRQRPSVLVPALLAGGAVLAAGTGAVIFGTGYHYYEDKKSSCGPRCPPSDRDVVHTREIVSDVLWGVAAAALVVDVALWGVRARRIKRLLLTEQSVAVRF